MKTTDVPFLRQEPMPEPKTPDKADPKPAAAPAKADLRPAGEASDPEVHRLLAEVESARLNNDDAAVKAAIQRIADLGYAAS